MTATSYWLENVRLEEGYVLENGTVTGTETRLYHILIKEGKIADLLPAASPIQDELPKYGCKKLLMLPGFKEAHIHLDKTYYGGPWQAVRPVKSIFERIEHEKELLPKLRPTAQARAEQILNLILGYGSVHVRSHCNIEPVSGLKLLEATVQALAKYSEKLTHEIVAFPQHGLLRSDSVDLVRQALREGATLVGAVDPYTVDGDIERSLQTVIDLAVEAEAGVDIHLHDRGEAGKRTLNRLAELTEEAGLHGRVTVSHCFWFADAPLKEAEELATRFAQLGISIASTVPIGRRTMPLPMLQEKGVKIELATDSLTDHWSPFGTGDNLEKAGRFAELYGYNDELALAQSLGTITGGIVPLNKKGEKMWPKAGDEASVVFVEASCSAEAIARKAKRCAVLFRGCLVAGALE